MRAFINKESFISENKTDSFFWLPIKVNFNLYSEQLFLVGFVSGVWEEAEPKSA